MFKLTLKSPLARLCFALLTIDLILICLHGIWFLQKLPWDSVLSMEQDRGLAEFCQYGKELAIFVILFVASYRLKQRRFLVLSLLFVYLFLDDAFSLHEAFGLFLTAYLPESFMGISRMKDIGELLFSAAAGLSLLTMLAWAYRNADAMVKSIFRDWFCMILLLAGFGVVVDFVHGLFSPHNYRISILLGFIEEAGELIVMSSMLAYAFHMVSSEELSECGLCDRVFVNLLAVVRINKL